VGLEALVVVVVVVVVLLLQCQFPFLYPYLYLPVVQQPRLFHQRPWQTLRVKSQLHQRPQKVRRPPQV
jgi:hypothetical protein